MEGFLGVEMWVKLALAVACGAAVGLEREWSDKPAGLRTNMLITIGSTVITMTSIHLALGYAEPGTNIADPGRIAAQIVSGVGFLGAGTIIQARGAVHGLTTAATIWVMAGIGIAIGSGYYEPAVATTVLLVGVLVALGWLEARIERPQRFAFFHVASRREPGVVDTINDLAEARGVKLDSIALERDEDGMHLDFSVTCTAEDRDAILEGLLDVEAVREVRVNE